jgi:hypothetical protein
VIYNDNFHDYYKTCSYHPPHHSSITTAIKAAAVYDPSDTTEELHHMHHSR